MDIGIEAVRLVDLSSIEAAHEILLPEPASYTLECYEIIQPFTLRRLGLRGLLYLLFYGADYEPKITKVGKALQSELGRLAGVEEVMIGGKEPRTVYIIVQLHTSPQMLVEKVNEIVARFTSLRRHLLEALRRI